MVQTRPALFVLAATLVAACGPGQPLVVANGADAPPSVTARAADALRVRYLGNEGFLVSHGQQRVLIDGLFGEGIRGYDVVPRELRAALEKGAGEWGGVTVAIASHYHRDHFDPEAVTRFLTANPEVFFISTPQAAASFAAASGDRPDLRERFRAVLPAPGAVETLHFDEIRVEVLNLHHGAGNPPTENLGVVVSLGGQRFLHFGDTEAKMADFEPYLELLAGTEVALLPFWFLSSDWRADLVRDRLEPRRIVVAHMPTPDAPAGYFARWTSYDELRAIIEERFPEAWIPTIHGQPMP